MTTTVTSKKLIKDFEKIYKENLELRAALKAVMAGEMALRQKRTRSMKKFLSALSLADAKNN